MELYDAVDTFEALAHGTRLGVYRLLVKAGPGGLTAGDIAGSLHARKNTMSSHLHKLQRAGLVTSERQGRNIIYRADYEVISQLMIYLMDDCCGGKAAVCDPVAASIKC